MHLQDTKGLSLHVQTQHCQTINNNISDTYAKGISVQSQTNSKEFSLTVLILEQPLLNANAVVNSAISPSRPLVNAGGLLHQIGIYATIITDRL